MLQALIKLNIFPEFFFAENVPRLIYYTINLKINSAKSTKSLAAIYKNKQNTEKTKSQNAKHKRID